MTDSDIREELPIRVVVDLPASVWRVLEAYRKHQGYDSVGDLLGAQADRAAAPLLVREGFLDGLSGRPRQTGPVLREMPVEGIPEDQITESKKPGKWTEEQKKAQSDRMKVWYAERGKTSETIKERIAKLIEEDDLNDLQIGRRLNLSNSVVSKYRREMKIPTKSARLAIRQKERLSA